MYMRKECNGTHCSMNHKTFSALQNLVRHANCWEMAVNKACLPSQWIPAEKGVDNDITPIKPHNLTTSVQVYGLGKFSEL